MSTRRPLQPLSPLSANVAGAKYNYLSKDGTDGLSVMEDRAQDDMQTLRDNVSLTSLENDDADDFDRLMIQNARDERRLNDALQGKVQPFRKARTHPRVGVTLENLERHNARNNAPLGANAHVKFESPSSSSGSVRSDPAIQPPTGWGRKGRVKRNWMRTITSDEENTDGTQEDTIARFAQDEPVTPRAEDADKPRQSIEDSPLSRKSSILGTPASSRQRRIEDLDFDLNEASVIASTPYLPSRNTVLDDIRQREIESLKEQGVTTSRLGKIRESSPQESRRPRSSSAKSTSSQTNGTEAVEQAIPGDQSPDLHLRKRTNSWQTSSKSQPVIGEGNENSPIVVYKKSSETVGIVDRGLLANAQPGSKRPSHRREDSQDLLRRLARVSNTPSPGRIATSRPQTAPARQLDSSSQTLGTKDSSTPLVSGDFDSTDNRVKRSSAAETEATAPEVESEEPRSTEAPPGSDSTPERAQAAQIEDVDATPMPDERSILNPKTPVVTGAWVDTILDNSHPATVQPPPEGSRSPSKIPKGGSPIKRSQNQPAIPVQEETHTDQPEATRPVLPRSALAAIVEEARASGRQRSDDYGDSTINSLEELIAPMTGNPEAGEVDEDTLQGLQLPTGTPRNEAERQRQQELLQLYRMNDRLRAARTGLRDASRGIKRVENRVEEAEEMAENGDVVRVVYRSCPCAIDGEHQSTLWGSIKLLFYDERLKSRRRGWGLTMLSIALVTFFIWLILENTAWYVAHLHIHSNVDPK